MKRLLILLSIPAAAICLVAGVGLLLPVEHVATTSASFPVPAERVYDVISDIQGQVTWRRSVDRVEELQSSSGRRAWRELGAGGPVPMELVESDPPRRWVAAIISEGMPFGGTWSLEIDPTPEGARLTITEAGEVYNVIFRALSRYVIGHHRTMTHYLEDLGGHFGVEVEVEVLR